MVAFSKNKNTKTDFVEVADIREHDLNTHTIHVWYIYLHLPQKSTLHVGKYTSPMDPMGYDIFTTLPLIEGDRLPHSLR